MFSGYCFDPQLNTEIVDAKEGEATDSSMLMGLGQKRAKAKELFVDELTEK